MLRHLKSVNVFVPCFSNNPAKGQHGELAELPAAAVADVAGYHGCIWAG